MFATIALLLSLASPARQHYPSLTYPERVIEPGAGDIHDIAVSPDGARILVACASGRVFVYEIATGDRVRELESELTDARDVEFDRAGSRMLSVHENGSCLWDARSLELVRRWPALETGGYRGAFAPDGSLIAIGAEGDESDTEKETQVDVWKAGTGGRLALLGGFGHRVELAFRFDSKSLLVTSPARSEGHVHRLDKPKAAPVVLKGHSAGIVASAWSPAGDKILTVSSDVSGRLWEATTGLEIRMLRGHVALPVDCDFSPDGRQFSTTCGADGRTLIWSTENTRAPLDLDGQESVTRGGFAPKGHAFVTVGSIGMGSLFDVRNGDYLTRLFGHKEVITAFVFTPDARWIVTGSHDDTVRVWKNPLAP